MDNKKEKKLKVDNLTISFRTVNGNVQAVRGISFDLYKEETLCIVGESGSGKSVTSRAILGILAKNAMIQGGKIFYDGKDLLKISEDEFHKIRGDKIAMIFQDPMSSLNPIMRVGKQLTEAMILKNKANRREARKSFNKLLAKTVELLNLNVTDKNEIDINKKDAENFNKFEIKHLELESSYDRASEACDDLNLYLKDVIFKLEKKAAVNFKRTVVYTKEKILQIKDEYYCPDTTKLVDLVTGIKEYSKVKKPSEEQNKAFLDEIIKINNELESIKEANTVKFNFFALGYYLTFVSEQLPPYKTREELNKVLRKELDNKFMLDYIKKIEKALTISNERSYANSKLALEALRSLKALDIDNTNIKEYKRLAKDVVKKILSSIDELDIYRTSPCYTFKYSIVDNLNLYFSIDSKNAKEKKRYDKEKAKHDNLVAKGKTLTWSVVPQTVWNKEEIKKELFSEYDYMIKYLEKYIKGFERSLNDRAVDIIDFFKAKASDVATKVTKEVARNKAIKLMEEVGINEPRRRFKQYPFEFSGGMRQRIVIAIALAANPDILICDEPTTALDVTIQSQILELITKLKKERHLSIIFITHDMGVVANMADRIAVMYAGKIVEIGTSQDIFYNPKHPYTWALLSSMPDLDTKEKLESIPGTPPNMIYPPKGDAFAARNKYAMKIDFEMQPPMFKVSDTHYAATWLLHPDAPKVSLPTTLVERINRMKERVKEDAK